MRGCRACLFVVFLSASMAHAETILAPSCSQSDVEWAINTAKDGDTVIVPPGQSVWTYCMQINPMPSILLLGAGMDKTRIINQVPKTGWKDSPLWITGKENKPFRISGFTFEGGAAGTGNGYQGAIRIDGDCKAFRVDHCIFRYLRCRAIGTNGHTFGLIDHCQFMAKHAPNIHVSHDAWGGHSFGDGSWNAPLSLGTEKAIYIEDNIFIWEGSGHAYSCVDSCGGGRYVFRHNQVHNTYVINHGTETPGRHRSCFSVEIYENHFTRLISPIWYTLFHIRGGTGVIFNNMATGNYSSLCHVANYRDYHNFAFWGACDGTSPYDKNDGLIYDTGQHTGANASPTLTCSVKNWTVNQWFGYSLHNTTQGTSSVIKSNSSDSITYVQNSAGPPMTFDLNDDFTILRAYPCLDQVGRSTGDLLHNYDPPLPKAWPQQAQEPFYEWNNTINSADVDILSDSPHIVENRDYFNDTKRPGYAPYLHPHPLGKKGDSLVAGNHKISASLGGKVDLHLLMGGGHSGRGYLVLGSASGTQPGFNLPGGLIMPLNWDAFTELVAKLLNSPIFSHFAGTLDGEGRAVSKIIASPLTPGFVGTKLNFAFCLIDPIDGVSNPVEVEIVP